jgi:miniconductance mechanosensitive channel
LVATLAYLVAKKIILRLVRSTAKRTKTHWDDALVESKVFARLALLVPGVVVHVMAASAFGDYPTVVSSVKTAAFVYLAVVAMSVFDALLDGVLKIYRTHEVSKRVPINPFLQVLRIAVYFIGGIVILAILLGKSPVVLFSGLGAFTAVLMLIFKDSILGFVAGLQLISNNITTAAKRAMTIAAEFGLNPCSASQILKVSINPRSPFVYRSLARATKITTASPISAIQATASPNTL